MPTNISAPKGNSMPVKLKLKLANECSNFVNKTNLKLSETQAHLNLHIIHSYSKLNSEIFDRLMELFELLMRDYYEKSSWGWNESEKLSEFKNKDTRFLIVTKPKKDTSPKSQILVDTVPTNDDEIVGFLNIRFEIGSSKDEAALYVYELHIHPEFQRQKLGTELMDLCVDLAQVFHMDKIMLTVFRANEEALKFYSKLKFSTDKSSPAVNEADYVILSRKVKGAKIKR